jgi:predicted MFS family arabinose efflux permease
VPFLVSAVIELVNITLTILFLPGTRPQRRPKKVSVTAVARVVVANDEVRSLIARHFLFIFAVAYFFTIFALFVQRALGMGPEHASWLMAGAGIVGGIMLVAVVGPVARRVGDATVAQYGFMLSAVAYLALGFAHNLWFFAAVLVVWAAGASCIEPTIAALLSEGAGPDQRGAVMGFNDAMSNVALMAAPSLGGKKRVLKPGEKAATA